MSHGATISSTAALPELLPAALPAHGKGRGVGEGGEGGDGIISGCLKGYFYCRGSGRERERERELCRAAARGQMLALHLLCVQTRTRRGVQACRCNPSKALP